MEYRREIDGLRALAIVPVILFHAGFGAFSGGFVGVDVFFVISGYLITTIILAEIEQGTFSIPQFYERRARRILPALFLVMLVCVPLAWLWLLPADMKDFSRSLVAVSMCASNILFSREGGYFDSDAELKPLFHTWSLAVEEQYYLLFPLLLVFCGKLPRRWVVTLLGLACVTSFAAAQWAVYAKYAAAFYLLPTRGWELLIGAFAAMYLSRATRRAFGRGASEVGGCIGLALILYSVFAFTKATPFPGFYALVPTVGTVLIILFASQQTIVGRFVGNRAFVGVGLISYSAYLWHQPLFAFARHKSLTEPGPAVLLWLSALTLALAYLSWRFVENYFRNKSLVRREKIVLYSLTVSTFFIVVGGLGHFSQDSISQIRFNTEQRLTIESASPSPKRLSCHFPQVNESLLREPCRYFSENTKVAVLGNSHAVELAYSLAELLKEHGVGIIHHTMSSCVHNYNVVSESNSVCGQWHKKVTEELINNASIESVVLSYRNEGYLGDPKYREALANMANDLVSAHKSVILVLQAPLPLSHINRHLGGRMPDLSGSIASRKREDWSRMHSESKNLLALLSRDVKVVDPVDLFCDSENCYVTMDGVSLFFDDQHISCAGGRIVSKHLLKELLGDSRR